MLLATSEQVRRIDANAITRFGVPGAALMETAGAAAANLLLERWPGASRRGVVVLAGKGNNGGDGFVVARHLARRGRTVIVMLAGARMAELSGDARTMAEAWHGRLVEDPSRDAIRSALLRAGVAVDALLGTGLSEAPRGAVAGAIEALESLTGRRRPRVLSLDVPSGLDASLGEVPGACVRADLTATFGLLKPGLVSFPGARFAGDVRVVRLGWPREALAGERIRAATIETRDVLRVLPPLDVEAHKGTRGRVLIVAGSDARPGAAALAAYAAFRAGAGLVTVATTPAAASAVVSAVPEAMTERLDAEEGECSAANAGRIVELSRAADAVVAGPGLGLGAGPEAIVAALATSSGPAVVFDADALTLLAHRPRTIGRASVLTPHPGEMARLLGATAKEVQASRIRIARACAERYGSVTLLKGARTLVCSRDGALGVNVTGNVGLATAGAGDVLSGVIGAWIARGVGPFEAACCAAWAHGAAADVAAAAVGGSGFVAREVADRIPAVLASARKSR